MRLDEISTEYPYEWNEKYIVKDFGEYRIAVNSPSSPTYLTVWTDENTNVGHLELNPIKKDGEKWMSIGSVSVDQKYRKEGIATALYRSALGVLPPEYKGLYSYLPNVANTKAHRIHSRLGGEVVNGDHMFIRRENLR